MGAYLVRRLVWAIVLFLALTFVTYVIFFVIPSDAVRIVKGKSASSIDYRETANLHGTVFQQYGEFLYRFVTGGALGESFFSKKSVNSIVLDALPVTLSLVIGGAIMWMLIALPIGILSALRPRSLFDRAGMAFVLIGVSAHPIWIGLILSYVFGYQLHLFPLTGYCDLIKPSTDCGGLVQWAYHMFLPWLTFALLFAAFYARMIRANVSEAMGEDFVRTARAKGASEWSVVSSHVLRNALLPIVAMLGADVGMLALGLIGQSLFVETVYSLPGLGKTLVSALQRHDLPIIEGVVVVVTITVVVVNLIADLVYALLDPRIKLRGAPV